jgi:hypothetical protein
MPNIKNIRVTRTIEYSPESYIEYCEEENETPTQDGFREYIRDWIDEDFTNDNGLEEIFYVKAE